MKIQYMMEFVYLVEKLNFTATASEFHLTQPTVSKHVQMLEDALGLPLLARTTHTVEVTEAGGAAYASFKRILQEHDRLMADMERLRHDLSGELRVGVLYYGIREYVQPFVNAFRKALPQIKVIYVSCQNYQVFELLKNGRIDIGIVARVDEEAVAQFDYVPIKREHLKCMISKNHPLAKQTSVTLADLSEQTMVYLSAESSDLTAFKDKLAFKNAVDAVQIDMVPMVLEETNGFFLAMDTLKNMNSDSVVFLTIDDADLTMEFGYVFPRHPANDATHLFAEHLYPL